MTVNTELRSTNIIVTALGGEGGGVLANWLIEVANNNNWTVQSTSLAGVAQRTGATIYYLEIFPRAGIKDSLPIMSLSPTQGDIDIAISSEIAEAGRMLQRGFVTPDRTTLISSSHRVYAIDEKTEIADGTMQAAAILDIANRYSKHFVHYDMQAVAQRNNAVISSVLFGALAGSGALPFNRESYEEVIRQTGKAVATNLAAFTDSYEIAQKAGGAVEHYHPQIADAFTEGATEIDGFSLPAATTVKGQELLAQLAADFPQATQQIIYEGVKKAIEYQDFDYASHYLDQVASIVALDSGDGDFELTNTTARYLALWMCFEDIPRVAQLKIRHQRMEEIRKEVKAEDQQIFYVTEYFRPRPEEICAILPAPLGRAIIGSKLGRKALNLVSGAKKLKTNTLTIYFSLRFLAMLRRFRRSSLGYHHEHSMINNWLDAIRLSAGSDRALAIEVAECGRIVKGYGSTRERTSEQNTAIVAAYNDHRHLSADDIKALRDAALEDDSNTAFSKRISALTRA
ncbi:indolepyruvate oxidoreductase subunit beta family protein [SAR92 clade bacterium H455]|uniref:Indolepyruvate oxidoreductase subunit beta family protein n=1 Tax=SAR92 clade bacterium H455 TaxID=2974818 RepID=A0ABY5TQG5_9GAMM|nr:indolepyruvate oxidoreductase subunit beta family protein [SAR92 clade bacterium H455]